MTSSITNWNSVGSLLLNAVKITSAWAVIQVWGNFQGIGRFQISYKFRCLWASVGEAPLDGPLGRDGRGKIGTTKKGSKIGTTRLQITIPVWATIVGYEKKMMKISGFRVSKKVTFETCVPHPIDVRGPIPKPRVPLCKKNTSRSTFPPPRGPKKSLEWDLIHRNSPQAHLSKLAWLVSGSEVGTIFV